MFIEFRYLDREMRDNIKAGVWIRVSTELQVKVESPKHHEIRARQYINSRGWNLVKIYHLDGVSGKTVMKHPETQRMLRDVRNGVINCLVFTKLSRLARSTKELLEFAEIFRSIEANLISISENIDTSTPSGMLFFTIISAMAEWEREEISSRVSLSIPIRAKLGKPLGGQAIFGYSWQNKEYVVNEYEAPIRKLIYEIFLRTRRKKTTANELNKLGYRTRKGALFSDTTIRRLLRDTTAKGERIVNYTKIAGNGKRIEIKKKHEWTIVPCPRIVSDQIWNKVNSILDEQEIREAHCGRKSKYLLSGFVKCCCLKKMYVRRTRFYQCRICKIKISINEIDDVFWSFLFKCLENIDFSKLNEKSKLLLLKKEALTEEIANEKATFEKEMKTLLEMRMNNEITKENFSRYYHLLNTKIIGQESLLQRLSLEMNSEIFRLRFQEDLFQEIRLLLDNWTNMIFEKKRAIIEAVTKEIVICEKDIKIEFTINLKDLFEDKGVSGKNLFVLPSSHFKQSFLKAIPRDDIQTPRTIGEHLRKKRIHSGLSQAKLAEILQVSTDCITYWENNRSNPQISYYPRIHHFLGFSTVNFNEAKFCDFIKSYRRKNGISCKELGLLLKVAASTVRAWERGMGLPTKKMRLKLGEFFGEKFLEVVFELP